MIAGAGEREDDVDDFVGANVEVDDDDDDCDVEVDRVQTVGGGLNAAVSNVSRGLLSERDGDGKRSSRGQDVVRCSLGALPTLVFFLVSRCCCWCWCAC